MLLDCENKRVSGLGAISIAEEHLVVKTSLALNYCCLESRQIVGQKVLRGIIEHFLGGKGKDGLTFDALCVAA